MIVDPITLVGTAGAIVGIIDVVGKTIKSLRDLHDRWKDADFTVLNLISQLTALKAAVGKIQEWIDSDPAEQHHQLVMDLDLSVACCKMLIDKMDAQISELHRTADDDALDLGSKIKFTLGSKANEDLQKMIERQISALNLLLTACNFKTAFEQQVLLENSSSRKTFKQVKDDSSSLYVNRDTASFYSQCTNNLSKISMVFQFDRELFASKVYERALRGSLKESLRRQPADVEPTNLQPVPRMPRSELEERQPSPSLIMSSRFSLINYLILTGVLKNLIGKSIAAGDQYNELMNEIREMEMKLDDFKYKLSLLEARGLIRPEPVGRAMCD